jgi:hypothetical protein
MTGIEIEIDFCGAFSSFFAYFCRHAVIRLVYVKRLFMQLLCFIFQTKRQRILHKSQFQCLCVAKENFRTMVSVCAVVAVACACLVAYVLYLIGVVFNSQRLTPVSANTKHKDRASNLK